LCIIIIFRNIYRSLKKQIWIILTSFKTVNRYITLISGVTNANGGDSTGFVFGVYTLTLIQMEMFKHIDTMIVMMIYI